MSKSKGINQNQLILVLSGLEHTLREGSNSVETYRDDSLSGISIDTDELRELLKRLKDALRFTKRCIKEYESVVLAPDDVDSLDDSEDDDEEMETEEGDDEDDESDTYLFQQKPNCMPCCNSPSHNVEEVEDDEEDDDEEPAWCTECSTTHAGDCDSGEEE